MYYWEGGAPSGFGAINVTRYCNEEVDELIRQTDSEADPVARASLYNQADALYLDEVAVVPLYQKPTYFAWSSAIEGRRTIPPSKARSGTSGRGPGRTR